MVLTKRRLFDNNLMDREIREGLPVDSFLQLADALQASPEVVTMALRSRTPATLRRLKRQGKRMEMRESEGVVRLFRIYLRAWDVLGSKDSARKWLCEGNRKLGGMTPIELAATEPGARQVENILGRIEHGVFS